MKTHIKILIIYFSFAFYSINILAQNGPGGVGSADGSNYQPTNKIWYDASSLSLSNADKVNVWYDLSGNTNDATQAILNQQPTFYDENQAGYDFPVLYFDNTGGESLADFMPFNGNVIVGSDYTVIFVGQRRSSGSRRYIFGGTERGASENFHVFWENSSTFNANHYGGDLSTPMITGETFDGGTNTASFGIFTTRLGSTEPRPQRKNYQNNYYLGGKNDSRQLNNWEGAAFARTAFDGTPTFSDVDIAEVIIYSTAINYAQLEIVNNYLSEKYNITIDNDRYTAATGYNYKLAGIGDLNYQKHILAGSSGFYLKEQNSSLNNGEFIFFSHNNATNNIVNIQSGTNVTNCGAEASWNRNWYLAKNNVVSVDAKFIFDIPEGFDSGLYPGDIDNYVLLYKANLVDDYSIVASISKGLEEADQIFFEIENANLNDGFYTFGSLDQTTSPLQGCASKTWFAYKSGDWDDPTSWTLDPSGNQFVNPSNQTPSSSGNNADYVVIHSGKTITVHAGNNNKINAILTVDGRLDLTTTSGHLFTAIKGSGRILMAADNFPVGDASNFVTAGQGEGSVEFYGGNYSLTVPREFYNVIVNLDDISNTVALVADYQINRDLTITKGKFQINDNSATDILNLNVDNDVLVETNGQITVGTGNTIGSYLIPTIMPASGNYHSIFHQFTISGNLTNNGIIKLTNQSYPVYNQFTTTGAATLIFNNPLNKTASLNGITYLYNLIIDKGIDKTYILTINSTNTNNLKLFGPNNVGRNENLPFTSANPEVRKAIWIHHGTLKLMGSILIPTLSEGSVYGGNGDYSIGASACLWIAGSDVYVYSTATDNSTSGNTQVDDGSGSSVNTNTSSQALSVYGKYKITAGNFETRNTAGIIFWDDANGQVYIEGGTTNVAQMRSANSGYSAGIASYIQTDGILIARGNETESGEYNGSFPLFGLETSESVFKMSGGEIILRDEDGDSDPEFYIPSAEGNYLVTGGTITVDIANTKYLQIYSTANLWNLVITNHNVTGQIYVQLDEDLVISNNLTINQYATLDVEDPTVGALYHNISIGKNFNINYNAIYDYGQNTTTFNGTSDGILYIGHPFDDAYEQLFYNLTINKPEGKKLTLIGDSQKEAGNVSADYYARLAQVENDFTIESGIFDQGKQSLRLFGLINIKKNGICGIYEQGVTDDDALIMFKDAGNILQTEIGAEFGNVKLNAGNNIIDLNSDVYIKRIAYYHGRINLGPYNLKVDYLDSYSEAYSVNRKMFITDGEASNGGFSLHINQAESYNFPVGIGTSGVDPTSKYTPVQVNVSIFNDDGYITVRPVDEELKTTNLSGGDILSYYWRVDCFDFTDKPTVDFQYSYNTDDLDGSVNETSFVPGKVLISNPYTRTYEDDVDKVDDVNNTITFNGSGSGFVIEEAAYTAGMPNRFIGTISEFHSNASYSNWDNPSTWLENQVPTEGSIVYIQNGNRVWGNSIPNVPAEIIFVHDYGTYPDATSENVARLQFQTAGTFNLAMVSGPGMISMNTSVNPTIVGDFGLFGNNSDAFFMYWGANATLTNIPTPIPNLMLESNQFIIDQEIIVNADLLHNGFSHITPLKNILIKGDLVMGFWQGGTFHFPASGDAITITVEGNIDYTQGSLNSPRYIIVDNPGTTSYLEHKLIVKGNILQGADDNNKLDLFNASDRTSVILELQGQGANTYTRNSSSKPDLYRLVMNKGEDQTNSFSFNNDFILNGATDGEIKALELQNGTLILNHQDIDIDLNTGGATFKIPATSCLELTQGELNIYGLYTGIYLDGKLKINGGTFDMINGYCLTYSASGTATIDISGGELNIGGQIRRMDNTEEGVLIYNQSGGSVILGEGTPCTNTRGVFEILNTGSSFTHTGGSFTIAGMPVNPLVPAFYFDPETVNLTTGTTITFGNSDTPANQSLGIYASKNLKNITVNGTSGNSPKVFIQTASLTLDENLTIGAGTEFDANGLQLNIKGNFINNGTFTHSNNLTVFNGIVNQEISGASETTFYRLTKSTSNTLTLQNNIKIDDDLRIEAGIFANYFSEATVLGDVYNVATNTWSGIGDGIIFAGNVQQMITGSGTYGKLTINNHYGVKVDVGFNITINYFLNFIDGIFDIGNNLLTLTKTAYFLETNSFSSTNMINTNNSFTDSGVKKYTIGGPGVVTFPIGSGGKYTPVRITMIENPDTTAAVTLKACDEMIPVITDDDESPDYEIVDQNNVLSFYWSMKAEGCNDVTGNVEFFYDPDDIKIENANGSSYTVADYLPARIRKETMTWYKYHWDDFDEIANKMVFHFSHSVSGEITGGFTAGIEPNTATRKGALPETVLIYETNQSGNWSDGNIWTPYIGGGPRGAAVKINENHTVVIDENYISVGLTDLEGVLNAENTFGNRLGIMEGTGLLTTKSGELPAGYYVNFFSNTGGTIEYKGETDYDILNNIASVNNLIISGIGLRRFPNLDLFILGDFRIAGDDETLQFINEYSRKINLHGGFDFAEGSFSAGTGETAIVEFCGSSLQNITGDFIGNNAFNHFTIANSSGLELVGDIEINGNLTFTNGIIYSTTDNTITLNNTDENTVIGCNSTSFVNGPLFKRMLSGGNFEFPIGDNNRLGKIKISNVSMTGTDIWMAQYFSNNPAIDGFDPLSFNTPLEAISTYEYWTVKAPVATNTAKIELRWDSQSAMPTDDVNRTNLRIAEWQDNSGLAWNEVDENNVIIGTTASGTITSTVFSGFNKFAEGNHFGLASKYQPKCFYWDGSESTVWNNAANWNLNLVPTALDTIDIPDVANDPVIDINANSNQLTLAASATLTINQNKSLTLSGDLIMNGTITIKSGPSGTGSLIDNSNISGTGTAIVERYLTANKFHYVSSPVSNASPTIFTVAPSGANNLNFYVYNEENENADWLYGWDNDIATSTDMTVGRGYATYLDMDYNYSITGGLFNTGDIFYDITNTNLGFQADGWNLVGNPYPATLYADEFIYQNSSVIDGTLYFWDDDDSEGTDYNTSDYASWNLAGSVGTGNGSSSTTGYKIPDGNIAVGQAFFVHKTDPGTSALEFNTDMRKIAVEQFFKQNEINETSRLRISFSNNERKLYNESLIVFIGGATEGFDNLFDGKKLKGNNDIAFYSKLNNENYAIQSFPLINEIQDSAKIVNLGFDISQSGQFDIAFQEIENFDEDIAILLIDNELDSVIDLRNIEKYSFSAEQSENNSRFSIIFIFLKSNNNSDDNTDIAEEFTETAKIFSYGNTIFINSENNKGGIIDVYDLNGKLIISKEFKTNSFSFPVNNYNGIIISKVIFENETLSKKLIITN
ncbi:MAG: T9SS type A sorting domain-containing protein [Bacteroidales bacterium]|nr:T9SS type A sorting domain-containing protein [Bacteroidales bacterium]MBN2757039.1 T9SS type A sorting domain-containing protein [Bacteroidales bacterium]